MRLPAIAPDDDSLAVALSLIAEGFAVVPVKAGTKNPGSVLGPAWQSRSITTPADAAAIWAGSDYGVGVHVGGGATRAVVIDVDAAADVEPDVRAALRGAPFTSSRDNDPERGHYWFDGGDRLIGNSRAGLAGLDVRGGNGFVVVHGPHAKADQGGRYLTTGGALPALPALLGDRLRDRTEHAETTAPDVARVLDAMPAGTHPTVTEARDVAVRELDDARRAHALGGAGRHAPAVEHTARLVRFGHQDFPGARAALADVRAAFLAGRDDDRSAIAEWDSLLGGAVRLTEGSPTPEADRYLDVDAMVAGMAVRKAQRESEARAALAAPHLTVVSDVDAEPVDPFELAVDAERFRLRVRTEAARRQHEAGAAAGELPAIEHAVELLAEPDEDAEYRIADLWPTGGRIVVVAPAKTGKSTLLANVLRSLVDGERFLGRFDVVPVTGRVVLIDNELDRRMIRRWLRDQGIVNLHKVRVLSLRGRVGTFDLLDDRVRARWAKAVRAESGDVVLFDCLRPVLDALGLKESTEAGRFLTAFDALLAEADVAEAAVVHHAGHATDAAESGERARGDSRIRDWPDATWTLTRDRGDDEDGPLARYLAAEGRDVHLSKAALTFDETTRRLTYAGGSPRDVLAARFIPAVLDYLVENPGASGSAIEGAKLGERAAIRAAVRRAMSDGRIETRSGPRGASCHYLTDSVMRSRGLGEPQLASSPPARQRGPDDLASSPYGLARSETSTEPSTSPRRSGEDEDRIKWRTAS